MSAIELATRLDILHGTLGLLLAEDDRDVLWSWTEMASICPLFAVHQAIDMPSAIECVRTRDLDAAIIDLGLPTAEDGYAVLRAIDRRIPSIVVTGRTSEYEYKTAEALGACAVIIKPVLDYTSLLSQVFDNAILHRLEHLADESAMRKKSISILCAHKPTLTSTWAIKYGCDPRHLRGMWAEADISAQYVLKLHTLYRLAFDYYCCEHTNMYRAVKLEQNLLRLLDYFDTRPRVLELLYTRARISKYLSAV